MAGPPQGTPKPDFTEINIATLVMMTLTMTMNVRDDEQIWLKLLIPTKINKDK